MQIKKKADAEFVIDRFNTVAHWDSDGEKHYFVFADRKRGGQWTLMKDGEDRFSIHGLGEDYHDEDEMFFEERSSVVSFMWENRSALNAAFKNPSGQA
ncbi:hypothetical protein N6H14_01195 [Paenibacillus sp. CC-CFT747]|nr:hypothetical protein N6H14_01195 [Paenibacillus sp. CC-CFT747]